jgi:hypothetical protein
MSRSNVQNLNISTVNVTLKNIPILIQGLAYILTMMTGLFTIRDGIPGNIGTTFCNLVFWLL